MIEIEPFFFEGDSALLCGVWRLPSDGAPANCWVFCPPFAEEEKSAHRTLVELANALVVEGDAVLFFAYSGTGDSEGDFADASLEVWRNDIRSACAVAATRFPQSTLSLLGLRLGASLAAQIAQKVDASRCVLLEPIWRGRSYLMQQTARKKIRAMMTAEESPEAKTERSTTSAQPYEDLDGWPLGAKLKDEFNALDLQKSPPNFGGPIHVFQIGPREEITLALHNGATLLKATARAVVMPPFWNRLDLSSCQPLIEAVEELHEPLEKKIPLAAATEYSARSSQDSAFTFANLRNETLVAVAHQPPTSSPKFAIVMLHGWTGYRTGPHQMLTRAARRFSKAGHAVLRFDFAGRGDSGGESTLSTLATMADDARVAIAETKKRFSNVPIIVLGLCSGCEVAVAVASEPDVEALILWSAPVFAAQQTAERVGRKRFSHLGSYARKLLRPATWKKILGGQVDVGGVGKVLQKGGGEEFRNIESGEPGHLPPGWREGVLSRFKATEFPAFMVYGIADPTTQEALAWYCAQLKTPPEVAFIEGANHSYYGLDWEEEVLTRTQEWLTTRQIEKESVAN